MFQSEKEVLALVELKLGASVQESLKNILLTLKIG